MNTIFEALDPYDLSGILEYCYRNRLLQINFINFIIHQTYPGIDYDANELPQYLSEYYNVSFYTDRYTAMSKTENTIQKKNKKEKQMIPSVITYINQDVHIITDASRCYIIPINSKLQPFIIESYETTSEFEDILNGNYTIKGSGVLIFLKDGKIHNIYFNSDANFNILEKDGKNYGILLKAKGD